jgi:hypothetical protein
MFSENFVPIGLIRTTSISPDPYRIHFTSKASRAFLLYTKENRPMRFFRAKQENFISGRRKNGQILVVKE